MSFDAALLLELAEAIGSLGYKENKKCRQVVLTFNTKNNEDAIIVTTDEVDHNLGVLMPMRAHTKAEDKKGPVLK